MFGLGGQWPCVHGDVREGESVSASSSTKQLNMLHICINPG